MGIELRDGEQENVVNKDKFCTADRCLCFLDESYNWVFFLPGIEGDTLMEISFIDINCPYKR
jgi:hypothetical protein